MLNVHTEEFSRSDRSCRFSSVRDKMEKRGKDKERGEQTEGKVIYCGQCHPCFFFLFITFGLTVLLRKTTRTHEHTYTRKYAHTRKYIQRKRTRTYTH